MAKHRGINTGDVVAIARALADPTRLRVLHALRKGELCVCQITAFAALAPSTVSRHMSLLNAAGLVASRKDGRWVYYRLPEEPESQAVSDALAWALAAFEATAQAREDERRLNEIKRCDPEALCRKQRTN
jgi:DNA-binding transcriptional ArsR family regulator